MQASNSELSYKRYLSSDRVAATRPREAGIASNLTGQHTVVNRLIWFTLTARHTEKDLPSRNQKTFF